MGIVGRKIRGNENHTLVIIHIPLYFIQCSRREGFYPLCLHTFQGALINLLNNQAICKGSFELLFSPVQFHLYDLFYHKTATSYDKPLFAIAHPCQFVGFFTHHQESEGGG